MNVEVRSSVFGVNYFFCLTTIISLDQRQLLLTSSAGAKRNRGAGGAARACLFCSFLRREKRRRWESGKPALGFPLFHPPSRRSCGNVGISPLWARFPRGSWEAWETCFWFSTLSTAPPFPQLSSRWILAWRAVHSALSSTWPSACCFFLASSTR
ncbi:MAG: hypothetical protein JWP08_1405 [Bryobacterales bacterium]|nr:hypothetical protein [Bryobacterales bacterium]